MAHYLGKVVRVESIHDVEEILSGRPFVLRILVREVRVEDRVALEFGIERLHRQLVVLGDLDLLDLHLLEQLLLAAEDVLHEVLVDDALRRQVELQAVHIERMRMMIEAGKENEVNGEKNKIPSQTLRYLRS